MSKEMGESRLRFRLGGTSDVDSILGMMHGLQQDDPWSVPFREQEVRRTVLELLEDPSVGRFFMISRGESCVGYLVLSFDFSLEYGGKNAWIDELFVVPQFRGQGIGADAVGFAIEAAEHSGAKVLHLEVNRGNPAVDLYKRCGFQEHDRFLLSKWLQRVEVASSSSRHTPS